MKKNSYLIKITVDKSLFAFPKAVWSQFVDEVGTYIFSDVKCFEDVAYQKLLKSVDSSQSYSKNEGGGRFRDTWYVCVCVRLDPVLVNVPSLSEVKTSSVTFARSTECLFVGDSDGQLSVLQLRGMRPPADDQVATPSAPRNSFNSRTPANN